jgi:hypothetical protein
MAMLEVYYLVMRGWRIHALTTVKVVIRETVEITS